MERIQLGEKLNSPLFERVAAMKRAVRQHADHEMMFRLAEETVAFGEELNRRLERYGFDSSLKKGVPEWMKLVGDTPEYFEIDAAARVIILEEVEEFVNSFVRKYGLEVT